MKKSEFYQLSSTLWLIVLLSSHWMSNDWVGIAAKVGFGIALTMNIILSILYAINEK